MKRLILALGLLAGAAHAQPAPHSSPATAFSPAQRADIVHILRDALRTDPSILRDAVAALQQDDRNRQDAATAGTIAAQQHELTADAADPSAGAPAGDVTVVEFYDTRCPYCRRLLPTLSALLDADPKLRVVYKDLPILGPDSVLEARALLAAQRQGGYARMQDAVMHLTAPSTPDSLRATAEGLGLDGARLQRDMADPAIQARLDGNMQLARDLHVDGTPAFVIGAQLIPGALGLADLQEAVEAARTR